MNKEDYNKYYIQGSDHYLMPKDVFDELFDEMINWKEETKELKKQVEEYENELEKADSITQSCIFNGKKESEISYRKCLNMLEKHNNQQKEFINYLEDNYKETQDIWYIKILQKYKEIIGSDSNDRFKTR